MPPARQAGVYGLTNFERYMLIRLFSVIECARVPGFNQPANAHQDSGPPGKGQDSTQHGIYVFIDSYNTSRPHAYRFIEKRDASSKIKGIRHQTIQQRGMGTAMGNNLSLVITTILIWAICAGLSITALLMGQDEIVAQMAAALLATVVVWLFGTYNIQREHRHRNEDHPGSADKGKNRSSREDRMQLLLDLMDEEERAIFKETLKRRVLEESMPTNDGELPYDVTTMESLLNDSDVYQQSRR